MKGESDLLIKSMITDRTGRHEACLPFVRINWFGWLLKNGKGFSKISKLTERDGAYHLKFDFPYKYFRLMRDWKLENLANGKEICAGSVSNGKKRTTSGVSLQFPNRFSGKLISVPAFDFKLKFPDFFTRW